jgi:hypothetical protein
VQIFLAPERPSTSTRHVNVNVYVYVNVDVHVLVVVDGFFKARIETDSP